MDESTFDSLDVDITEATGVDPTSPDKERHLCVYTEIRADETGSDAVQTLVEVGGTGVKFDASSADEVLQAGIALVRAAGQMSRAVATRLTRTGTSA